MKLQIEHLAPYLVHNPLILHMSKTSPKWYTLECVDMPNGMFLRHEESKTTLSTVINEHTRIMLRPLSHLTEPILPDTRKFIPLDSKEEKRIPLVELAERLTKTTGDKWSVNLQDCFVQSEHKQNLYDEVYNTIEFTPKEFSIIYDWETGCVTSDIILEVHSFLDENHFDWRYNLIKQGLAIEKPLK